MTPNGVMFLFIFLPPTPPQPPTFLRLHSAFNVIIIMTCMGLCLAPVAMGESSSCPYYSAEALCMYCLSIQVGAQPCQQPQSQLSTLVSA